MTRDDFLPAMADGYRDRFGFPASRRGQLEPAGNCLMFLAEEMIIRADLGSLGTFEWNFFNEHWRLCQLEPGNFRRVPEGCQFARDQEAWDDLLALSAAAAIIDRPYVVGRLATQIILFGRSHFYRLGPFRLPYAFVTSNPAPEETRLFPAFFGRYLQFVAHLRWCAGETPNWIQRFAWCWSVAFAGFFDPDGQDPWRLTYLQVRAQKIRRRWWHPEGLAEKIWRWRFLGRWPRGIRDVRVRYFGDDEDHPLAKFASMEF